VLKKVDSNALIKDKNLEVAANYADKDTIICPLKATSI
jgi:hypothetical protein